MKTQKVRSLIFVAQDHCWKTLIHICGYELIFTEQKLLEKEDSDGKMTHICYQLPRV